MFAFRREMRMLVFEPLEFPIAKKMSLSSSKCSQDLTHTPILFRSLKVLTAGWFFFFGRRDEPVGEILDSGKTNATKERK